MRTARKYDLITGQYEDYALPEGSTYYEDDMNKKIACCECAKINRVCLITLGIGFKNG